MEIRTLIITGDGINAENELSRAFIDNGSVTTIIHINDLILNPQMIHTFHIIGFPGGFSFGDEVRSGKVFAIKVFNSLRPELINFIEQKKLIIGICNGFQILAQMKLFDDFSNPSFKESHLNFTLAINDNFKFQNLWTKIKILNNNSPWMLNIDKEFYLPIRHKEGRILGDLSQSLRTIEYLDQVNGSLLNTAGITNRDGNVLGLMPHPEAATYDVLNPIHVPDGNASTVNKIFSNGINYIKENFNESFN